LPSSPDMTSYLHLIDKNTRGPRYDVTPLFADYEAFTALVEDLSKSFDASDFDVVAGIDALGFILGTALALHFQKGFVPVRKGGKLPVEVDMCQFIDYTGHEKSLELRADAIKHGTRVLIVDEWIETGAQVKAAIQLIEGQGGVIAGIAAINIDENEATHSLLETRRCVSAVASY
jgi:adenine phosphoribosyltransferase